jgi:hypothetical protein
MEYALRTHEPGADHSYGPMLQEQAEELGARLRAASVNGTSLSYEVLPLESPLPVALALR